MHSEYFSGFLVKVRKRMENREKINEGKDEKNKEN
jgi:hypothetical protein